MGRCANGSWDPTSPPPIAGDCRAGRLFTTSLSILTLEVYYRYLPMYRDYDDDQEKEEPLLKDDPKEDREEKPAVGPG